MGFFVARFFVACFFVVRRAELQGERCGLTWNSWPDFGLKIEWERGTPISTYFACAFDRFMENRITRLFGIKYPIIQAGMIWCSGWELAAAVSNAGGLGLIGAGSMYPDQLRENIRKCKAATDKPFGVNLPLLYPELDKHIAVTSKFGAKRDCAAAKHCIACIKNQIGENLLELSAIAEHFFRRSFVVFDYFDIRLTKLWLE